MGIFVMRLTAGSAAIVTVLLGVTLQAMAADFIVPCPTWAVGDSWETRSFVKHAFESPSALDQTITVTSLVKSRDQVKIVVSEKRATQIDWVDKRIHRGAPPPPRIESWELVYEIKGDSIFLRQQSGDIMSMAYDPPAPFCGKIPGTVAYRVKGTLMGTSNESEARVTLRSLGKQTVNVPAGSFEAMVFESVPETKTDPSSSAGPPSVAPVVRSYMAEGVGLVKTVILSTVHVPLAPQGSQPAAEAALQQGVENLAKGGNASESMAALQKLAGSGSEEFKEIEAENATELVVYRKAK